MSTTSIVNQVNSQIANYAPAVVVAVQQFAENATGPEKQSVAVRILTGIEVGTGVLEQSPVPIVASTALLVNMIVQIAKLFKHPAFVPAPVAAAPPV